MVRVKRRYIVLDLLSPVDNCSQKLTGSLICASIRRSYQDLYGEFGIAYLGTFGVKYFNQITNVLIIQCKRDVHRQLLHAILFVKAVDSQPCTLSTIYIGATMKSCQKFLVRHSRNELFKVLQQEAIVA